MGPFLSSSSSSIFFQKGQYVSSKTSLNGAIVMSRPVQGGAATWGLLGYPQVGVVTSNFDGILTVKSYANDELRKKCLNNGNTGGEWGEWGESDDLMSSKKKNKKNKKK